ncbi:MAG: NADPH-dependent FMN reductase [Lautropia sp.]
MLKLVTLCGSIRKDSFNAALVRALPGLAPGDLEFVEGTSVADVPIYDGDLERVSGMPAAITALANTIREADGVVIVSPEYNYSIPGGLKNMLDWLSRVPTPPMMNKPVLIQSVSGGGLGGARMQHHLRQVLVALGARVFAKPEVMIGPASQRFDDGGNLTDRQTREVLRTQIEAFGDFVREAADAEAYRRGGR